MTIHPMRQARAAHRLCGTDAAIRAINTVKIDYYLMKPGSRRRRSSIPSLDDLLDEWQASYRPAFEGVRVIGHRWSAAGHQIKDFLPAIRCRTAGWMSRSASEAARLMSSQAPTRRACPWSSSPMARHWSAQRFRSSPPRLASDAGCATVL